MSTYLRRTPALVDVVSALTSLPAETWGLELSRVSGRPAGTVYPLLERLEREGLVESRWDADESRPGPRRRLYQLTTEGRTWAAERLRPARGRSAHQNGQFLSRFVEIGALT